MKEKEIYQEVLLKINENQISDAQLLLKNTKSYQLQELLGIVSCIRGEFDTAYNIFKKLIKIEEKDSIKGYFEYLEKEIKNQYIPLFNKLILSINSKSDSNIEETIINLENICKNTELYSIATLYFLREKNNKKAKIYYEKLKMIDSSDSNIAKISFYFTSKSINKKIKVMYGVLGMLSIGIGTILYKNNFLMDTINSKNIEISLNEKIKNEELKSLNEKLIEKENILSKTVVYENNESIKYQNKNLILNENELYTGVIRRIQQEKLEDAIQIIKFIDLEKLPEFKKREILFQKARAYEKLNNKEKALEFYKEYMKNSDKKEYQYYVNTVQKNIRKLENKIE